MPSFKKMLEVVLVGVVAVTSVGALPALPRISERALQRYEMAKRQAAAATTAASGGLTDVDILQFALTLENLETAFYQQGFAKFADSDFTALGLSSDDLTNLKSIGQTEQTHVTTLLSAIAGAGTQPVQACTYNFGFTDAAGMVSTANTLENIGVSAYLGAAPLVQSASILSVAAQIVTVEARHQTFIRTASKSAAVPSAFDTPLGPRSVFSLAAAFISSCPDGSNLNIQPFPGITMSNAAATSAAAASSNAVSPALTTAGTVLQLSTTGAGAANAAAGNATASATGAATPSGAASFCSFTNGGASAGGTVFAPFANGACTVPQNLFGETYVHLTSDAPQTGVLSDDITVAGPMVIAIN